MPTIEEIGSFYKAHEEDCSCETCESNRIQRQKFEIEIERLTKQIQEEEKRELIQLRTDLRDAVELIRSLTLKLSESQAEAVRQFLGRKSVKAMEGEGCL